MPTRYNGNHEQQRALNAYITLVRAANSVNTRAHRRLNAVTLTLGQFAVLEALHFLGPLRQHVLAAKLLCSPGNLSTVVSNLRRRRLVRRRRDPADARGAIVETTPGGAALIERAFPGHVEELVAAFAALSALEQDTLRSLCRKLGRSLTDNPPAAPGAGAARGEGDCR